MLLDERLQLMGSSANDVAELLSSPEGNESGHSFDTGFPGDVREGIDIDLVKIDGWGFAREFIEEGADRFTWTTPGCPKVEDSDLVPVDNFPVLFERGDSGDSHDDFEG